MQLRLGNRYKVKNLIGMNKVEVILSFNISDEGMKSEEFQELKNAILSGKMQRELDEDNNIKAKNIKATIKIIKNE